MCSRRPLTRGDVAAEVPRPDEDGAAQSVEVALRTNPSPMPVAACELREPVEVRGLAPTVRSRTLRNVQSNATRKGDGRPGTVATAGPAQTRDGRAMNPNGSDGHKDTRTGG